MVAPQGSASPRRSAREWGFIVPVEAQMRADARRARDASPCPTRRGRRVRR